VCPEANAPSTIENRCVSLARQGPAAGVAEVAQRDEQLAGRRLFTEALGRLSNLTSTFQQPMARETRLPRLRGPRAKRLEVPRESQRGSRPAASSLLETLLLRIVGRDQKLRLMRLRRRN
jgi:hypothetical protein